MTTDILTKGLNHEKFCKQHGLKRLKANRASATEEQIKERLRIRRENEKIKKPRETPPGHSQKIEAR